jgi:hypothetical protein
VKCCKIVLPPASTSVCLKVRLFLTSAFSATNYLFVISVVAFYFVPVAYKFSVYCVGVACSFLCRDYCVHIRAFLWGAYAGVVTAVLRGVWFRIINSMCILINLLAPEFGI